jgi:hypothetical protein
VAAKRRQSDGKVSEPGASGNDEPRFGRWRRKREEHRADNQQGDPHALDREGDPRGGVQSDEYRHAEATDVIEEEGGRDEWPRRCAAGGSFSGRGARARP